jgi:Universal stress protein UspA and related nucleotide-binding proteins
VKGILETADGASLLVVGSRGRSALKRTLFGSVATQISHHAVCPLVVVPAADSAN